MATEISDEENMRAVIDKLEAKNPQWDHSEVEKVVAEEYAALAGGSVKDYLSVLTERAAKKRLKKA